MWLSAQFPQSASPHPFAGPYQNNSNNHQQNKQHKLNLSKQFSRHDDNNVLLRDAIISIRQSANIIWIWWYIKTLKNSFSYTYKFQAFLQSEKAC